MKRLLVLTSRNRFVQRYYEVIMLYFGFIYTSVFLLSYKRLSDLLKLFGSEKGDDNSAAVSSNSSSSSSLVVPEEASVQVRLQLLLQ